MDKPEIVIPDTTKKDTPRFDIIDRVLTYMIIILAVVMIAPFIIAAIYHQEVALVAMIFEQETNPQFYMILSALVGTLTGKQIQKTI